MEKGRLHPSLQGREFTLDEVSFAPEKIPNFEVGEVDLTSRLTGRITLKTPLLSAPMDTVTEHKMAILMALMGGIGVIHFNMSIEDQVREIERVRRYEAGYVERPIVVGPEVTVSAIYSLARQNGFFSYPVTQDGTLDSPMIGIVTHRDVRYLEEDSTQRISEVMTPKEKMVTARREDTYDKGDIRAANRILREHKLDTLPVVDEDNKLIALVTDRDLATDRRYPLATKDENKQLKVLVAVESRLQAARDRIIAVRDAGAAGIVIDSRNIYEEHLAIARFTREEAPGLDIILGNVVTARVIEDVLKEVGECVDAFRTGMGTGEVCITTEALGLGRDMGSAIDDVDHPVRHYIEAHGRYIGIIADGGIKSPQHIVAALILGADAVMMGSELAGVDESPVPADWDRDRVMMAKKVRGMGSAAVIQERAGASRYSVVGVNLVDRFAEGIEKVIPYKGPGEPIVRHIFAGVRQAMQGLGYRDIDQLHREGTVYPYARSASKGTT